MNYTPTAAAAGITPTKQEKVLVVPRIPSYLNLFESLEKQNSIKSLLDMDDIDEESTSRTEEDDFSNSA